MVALAVDAKQDENILDLCCCPGVKLCQIAEGTKSESSVTGVDINSSRL